MKLESSQVEKKEKVLDQLEIVAQTRTEFGKGPAGRARRQGKTLAIVYGISDTKHLLLETDDFKKIFSCASHNTIIKLTLGSWSSDVIIKDYDYNIVRHEIRHVDFYEVQWADKVESSVPLGLVGKAIGQRDGGLVKQSLFEVKVKSMPMFIPKKMGIDITQLRIGDALEVKNIIPIENVEILNGTDDPVVSLISLKDMENKDEKEQE